MCRTVSLFKYSTQAAIAAVDQGAAKCRSLISDRALGVAFAVRQAYRRFVDPLAHDCNGSVTAGDYLSISDRFQLQPDVHSELGEGFLLTDAALRLRTMSVLFEPYAVLRPRRCDRQLGALNRPFADVSLFLETETFPRAH